jgi:hypothetical protein
MILRARFERHLLRRYSLHGARCPLRGSAVQDAPPPGTGAAGAGRPPSGAGLPLTGRVGLPHAGHLAGRDVQPVPETLVGDGEHQASGRRLVEVAGSLGPDLVGTGPG